MDLNMLMREQALSGLQVALDTAVTNGDTVAARKAADDIAKLTVQTAPKAPPFGQAEITAELDKQPWFGVDPKRSKTAVDLGKTMDPKKFATAAAFAEALVKAVDEEYKPAADPKDEGDEPEPEDEPTEKAKPKVRKTDGPEDVGARRTARSSGPWSKMPDAPADVQAEIKRAAAKFVPAAATKEQRESFTAKALESHYAAHERAKGKK